MELVDKAHEGIKVVCGVQSLAPPPHFSKTAKVQDNAKDFYQSFDTSGAYPANPKMERFQPEVAVYPLILQGN